MGGDGDRMSRPNSLLLDGAAPEREPLQFDVQLVGAPPEVEQLVNNIKQVAEDFLYHWKTFPIVLPASRFTGSGARPADLIVPPCDELDVRDAPPEPRALSPKQLHSIREKGLHKDKLFKPKKLSAKQLESIREWGEFEVPSRHSPGESQVWRVARWLQRGRARAREQLHTQLAGAAALLVVAARDRLLSDEPCSVLAGARCLLCGLRRLLDLFIGMPSLEARDLEKKIRDERSRYLVAELICMPEHQEDIVALGAWVSRALRRAAAEKGEPPDPRAAPPAPTRYTTPQRLQVDLRLYRRDLLKRAAPFLQEALERESRGWFLHFREKLACELSQQKMPMKDIEEEIRASGIREYVSRVEARVLADSNVRALGDDVPELLVAQLRASVALARAEDNVRRKLEAGVASAEARLVAAHPIMSASAAWRRRRLAAARARLADELRWAAAEQAAAAAPPQHRYLMQRDLAFRRDREPLLIKELRAAKTPTRQFRWATRRWRPQHWPVTRHFRGRAERIPTVLSGRPTSIVTPRSDPSQPVFLVDRERVRTTSTRWPGWRLVNFAHRSWSWGWNAMFLLGVVVPWCSPLSIRALFSPTPLVPEYELSQVNGTLFPKRSSEVQTMFSRLLRLWRYVSKERTRFETEPDTGLLGKGLSRLAHRVWTYGVVGGLGSLALLLLFPAVAVVGSLLALVGAAAAPLWAPLLAVGVAANNVLLYDLDCPDPTRFNRWFPLLEVVVWRILVLGVLQPLAACVVAFILCPLAALLWLVGYSSWWALVWAWQEAAWRALLARSARVPLHDSAFCKRVRAAPPALYQLSAPQAIAAVCARAEQEALTLWAQNVEAAIEKPLRDYRHFVDACFGPFSVQIAKTGAYKQLVKECSELAASLREKVAARRRLLQLGISDAVRARLRMTAPDLRRTIQVSSREVSRVLAGSVGDAWWSERGLAPRDWPALAANLLLEVFDSEILVAEQAARLVPLEQGAPAAAWAAPPDVLSDWSTDQPGSVCEWGFSPLPRVPPPRLDVSAFSPRAPPHPPLAAPPLVALVLYNRDAETPVPLDSELCVEILKTLEDTPDCDERRGVERCRGGAAGSDLSDDEQPEHTCSISGDRQCRWTLTGRGVRLRADLASPEDVTLEQGTCV